MKALRRIATLCNVPTACNRATADFLISSPLGELGYHRRYPNGAGEPHDLQHTG